MDYRIRELTKRIESNFNKKQNLSELALNVNLSVAYLQHLFKEETGKTIVQFISNVRFEKAKELLKGTHLRVKEVRHKVGFSDDSTFVRKFKLKFGKTPTQYRKSHQKSRNNQ